MKRGASDEAPLLQLVLISASLEAAATAAIATATAAAKTTTAAAAAAGAGLLGLGFIDSQGTPVHLGAVQCRNRGLGFFLCGHFDEAEAS